VPFNVHLNFLGRIEIKHAFLSNKHQTRQSEPTERVERILRQLREAKLPKEMLLTRPEMRFLHVRVYGVRDAKRTLVESCEPIFRALSRRYQLRNEWHTDGPGVIWFNDRRWVRIFMIEKWPGFRDEEKSRYKTVQIDVYDNPPGKKKERHAITTKRDVSRFERRRSQQLSRDASRSVRQGDDPDQ